jgi:hypothetical protein
LLVDHKVLETRQKAVIPRSCHVGEEFFLHFQDV